MPVSGQNRAGVIIPSLEVSVQGVYKAHTCHWAAMDPLGRCDKVDMWLYLSRG